MKLKNHWLTTAKKYPSPNYNDRPDGAVLGLLVIHNISLPPKQFGGGYIEKFFLNSLDSEAHPYFKTIADLQVSSHFLIDRTGNIVQFVACDKRAWHAGASCYQGKDNCNDFSIGIELEGADDVPYTTEQYAMLAQLVKCLQYEYMIDSDAYTGHEHIAPGRKTDPGPAFDWSHFKQLLQ